MKKKSVLDRRNIDKFCGIRCDLTYMYPAMERHIVSICKYHAKTRVEAGIKFDIVFKIYAMEKLEEKVSLSINLILLKKYKTPSCHRDILRPPVLLQMPFRKMKTYFLERKTSSIF